MRDAAAIAHQEADKESGILFPDRDLAIGEETVTVREFRFGQSGKAIPLSRGILGAIREAEIDTRDIDGNLGIIEGLLGDHWNEVLELTALATGKPRAWIEELSAEDGNKLAMTMVAVNAGFFLRRLAADHRAAEAARERHSPSSSPNSSAPDSDGTRPISRSG